MPTANQDAPVLSRVFEAATRLFFRTWCPLRVTGLANVPASPFLLCANHNSHLDSLVLMLATGQRFHRFALLAANDYFFGGNWRFRTLALVLTLIPIDRAARPASFRKTLHGCADFLHSGRALIVFPEGTRSECRKSAQPWSVLRNDAGRAARSIGIRVSTRPSVRKRQLPPKK